MRIEVNEEPMTALEDYASIPIAFEVKVVLDIQDSSNGLGDFQITERHVDVPYLKNYDSIDGENPVQWASRFDISNWGLFVARTTKGRRIGGAVVALNTQGLVMVEGDEDLAVLWDIRVAPKVRGQGVGTALFSAAGAWARAKGCRRLKVETQNINVPACRFYARQGCILTQVHRFVYTELPEEMQMLWYKDISQDVSQD
jgi:GNAT superfamily N-acetyltransferase